MGIRALVNQRRHHGYYILSGLWVWLRLRASTTRWLIATPGNNFQVRFAFSLRGCFTSALLNFLLAEEKHCSTNGGILFIGTVLLKQQIINSPTDQAILNTLQVRIAEVRVFTFQMLNGTKGRFFETPLLGFLIRNCLSTLNVKCLFVICV